MSEIRRIMRGVAYRIALVESTISPLLAPAKSHNYLQIEQGLTKVGGQVKALLDFYQISFLFFHRIKDDDKAYLLFHDWAIELQLYCSKGTLLESTSPQEKRIGVSFLYLDTCISNLALIGVMNDFDKSIFKNNTRYRNSYIEQRNEGYKIVLAKLDKFLLELVAAMCADGLTPVIEATSEKRFGLYQKALSRSNLLDRVQLLAPKE